MRRLAIAVVLCAVGLSLLHAKGSATTQEFFPLSAGTYWVFQGTVSWYDAEKDQPATEEVTWKMSVEKVIRRTGFVAAVVTGFPEDLNWSAGSVEPKPWMILEDDKHRVYSVDLGPEFDVTKLNANERVFDKFLVEDNVLFQWPLHKGDKFCDAESRKREDDMYCWVVAEANTKSLGAVKGLRGERQTVYQLEYRSNPDDTEMELVPGVGLLSYEYHHHGTVADTELHLVEFHPGAEVSREQGQNP